MGGVALLTEIKDFSIGFGPALGDGANDFQVIVRDSLSMELDIAGAIGEKDLI
jgi:hypothetical protein